MVYSRWCLNGLLTLHLQKLKDITLTDKFLILLMFIPKMFKEHRCISAGDAGAWFFFIAIFAVFAD